MRPTRAVIDLSAIEHNLQIIRTLAPTAKIMAVVKADAYGHGLVPVAKRLNDADALAVACIEEALELRQGGVDKPIILLEGVFAEKELELVEANDLEMVVHTKWQLDCIDAYPASSKFNIWLKFDSKMHRLGFTESEYKDAYRQMVSSEQINEIRLMTHFACADDISNDMTRAQYRSFRNLIENLSATEKKETSTANSAAVLAWPETHGDWVRPGLLMYGASPMLGRVGSEHKLLPAMTLESRVISIKSLDKGEPVGYGAAWEAPEKTNIAIVAIGYGDGYPRHAKSSTPVWVNGRLAKLAGRVSMDMIAIDLGGESDDQIGDRVVLWGKELPIEEVAKWSDTIPYTLMCGVTARVKYHWQGL